MKQDDLGVSTKEAQAEEQERLRRIQAQQQRQQKELWERIQQGRLQQQHAKSKNDLSIQYHDFAARNASENSSKIAGCLKGEVIKEEELTEIIDDPTPNRLQVPNHGAADGAGAEVEYEPITAGRGSKKKRNRRREGSGGKYCCVQGCTTNQIAHGP